MPPMSNLGKSTNYQGISGSCWGWNATGPIGAPIVVRYVLLETGTLLLNSLRGWHRATIFDELCSDHFWSTCEVNHIQPAEKGSWHRGNHTWSSWRWILMTWYDIYGQNLQDFAASGASPHSTRPELTWVDMSWLLRAAMAMNKEHKECSHTPAKMAHCSTAIQIQASWSLQGIGKHLELSNDNHVI